MMHDLDYKVVAPTGGSISNLATSPSLNIFDQRAIEFVAELSTRLMRDPRTANFAEVTAMAYWLRKANVKRMKKDFEVQQDRYKLPRGLVFHIAPSNVDTIFIYSLFLSIFCGNNNVVRLSSAPNEQVDSILAVFNDVIAKHSELAKTLLIVRYEHSEEISASFSAMCDVRMIWGGDETIRRIRNIPIPPRAKELSFADRFSMAAIDARAYLSADDSSVDVCTEGFYNDSFWFDQMACSSPRMLAWLGSSKDVKEAQRLFWQRLDTHLQVVSHEVSAASVMDKLVAQCSYAIEAGQDIELPRTGNRAVSRVLTKELPERFREIHCGNGLFLEFELSSLNELASFIDQKVQTLATFAISAEQIRNFFAETRPQGIDRVVPFGSALNFSPLWDGYDLLHELCRNVDIQL